jgi:hypothetical protein
MVFKKTQIALCLFTIGILFFSCKKDKFVGPELLGAGSDFDKKINFEIYQDNKKN